MSIINILKMKHNRSLFTTPSHNGNLCIMHKFYKWYKNDISETDTYNPQEALSLAEKKAAEIYGTKSTHFLTNGSTSGIIASVLTCCNKGKLLIWDKSHTCHNNAGILSGAEIVKYELKYNDEWGIYEPLTPEEIDKLLAKHKPDAIIITSPTYEGLASDIIKISKICKMHNTRLITDEAHGALYPFSDKLPESAVKYADFTVQSLHKTAGGINPTALLHCNCELSPAEALSKINTTSPSYPMLATIEATVNYLSSDKGHKNLNELINSLREVRASLTNLKFYGDDITKLLIKKDGLSGYELSDILFNQYNIEDERTNSKSTMLLTGLGTSARMIKRLLNVLKGHSLD